MIVLKSRRTNLDNRFTIDATHPLREPTGYEQIALQIQWRNFSWKRTHLQLVGCVQLNFTVPITWVPCSLKQRCWSTAHHNKGTWEPETSTLKRKLSGNIRTWMSIYCVLGLHGTKIFQYDVTTHAPTRNKSAIAAHHSYILADWNLKFVRTEIWEPPQIPFE